MPENDELDETYANDLAIINTLLNLNENNQNQIFNNIEKNYEINKNHWILKLLIHLTVIRPYLTPLYSKIMNGISKKYNIKEDFSYIQKNNPCLCRFLISSKYFKAKEIPKSFVNIPLYEKSFDIDYEGQYESKILYKDDINTLQQLLNTKIPQNKTKTFDIYKMHNIKPKHIYINFNFPKKVNSLYFCAIYGSNKCFSYLAEKYFSITDEICLAAAIGCNKSIVLYCIQKGFDLINYIKFPIEKHCNEIVDIILNNTKNKTYPIDSCIKSYNLQCLIKFIPFLKQNNKYQPNKLFELSLKSCFFPFVKEIFRIYRNELDFNIFTLLLADKTDDSKIVELVLKNMKKVNEKDPETNIFPMFIACKYNVINFVKNNNISSNFDAITNDGNNIVHYSCLSGNFKLVNYIITNKKINKKFITAKNNNLFCPIHYACISNSVEIIDLLVANGANIYETCYAGKALIHLASSYGYIQIIDYLLDKGIDINTCTCNGKTPLYYAAKYNQIGVVKHLIGKGANVNGRSDIRKKAPLHAACQYGNEGIVNILIQNGADVNLTYHKKKKMYCINCSHLAALYGSLNILEILQRNGCNLKAETSDSKNSLHFACESGNYECVKYLCDNGIDVNSLTLLRESPLIFACKNASYSIISFLLHKGANINVYTNEFLNPVHICAMNKDYISLKILLETIQKSNCSSIINSKDIYGKSPLYYAVNSKSFRCVQLLVENNADVNSRDIEGETPLYLSCMKKSLKITEYLMKNGSNVDDRMHLWYRTSLVESCRVGNYDIYKLLLSYGADPNAKTADNMPALHFSMRGHNHEIIKDLISKGLEINYEAINWNFRNITPLCMSAEENDPETLEILLKNGANPNHILSEKNDSNIPLERDGWTALMLSCKNNWVKNVEILLKWGADPNIVATSGETAMDISFKNGNYDIVTLLLKYGARMEFEGRHFIYYSIEKDLEEATEICLERGTDPNIQINGNSLLHIACYHNNLRIVTSLCNHKANTNQVNTERITPLHIACQNDNFMITKVLVDNNADMFAENNDFETPFSISCSHKQINIVEYFLNSLEARNYPKKFLISLFAFVCETGSIKLIKHLFKTGADINQKTYGKWKNRKLTNAYMMPIHYACLSGNIDAVKYLIRKGAKIDDEDFNESIGVHFACKSGSKVLAEYLFGEKLISINKQNFKGQRCIHFASMSGSVELVAFLISNGVSPNEQTKKGKTPLTYSIKYGHEELVKYLYSKGAENSTMTQKPIFIAINYGQHKLIPTLIEYGADPNEQYINGNTPIHIAAMKSNLDAINLLCEFGTFINAQNNDGNTALHIAVLNSWAEGIKLLIERGCSQSIENRKYQRPPDLAKTHKIRKLFNITKT